MRVKTSTLKLGTVMSSGETIISLDKSQHKLRGTRLTVVLEKGSRRRFTDWHYYGTVSVRSIPTDVSG